MTALAAQSCTKIAVPADGSNVVGLRKRYLDNASSKACSCLNDATERWTVRGSGHGAEKHHLGPDIEWDPSYGTFVQRVATLSKLDIPRPNAVPAGFPASVDKPWVWSGSDLKESDYLILLSADDIVEIETALSHFKGLSGNLGPNEVNEETFPLPGLGQKLQDIAEQVHNGIGFAILRGLEPKKYSAFENLILLLGITGYIAEKRGVQDASGNMIIHIKDLGAQIPDSDLRQSPYASNAQPFHNDVCDVLAMYCQEQAPIGGDSHLASCAKIYNEIAATRPDVIHTLAEPNWVFDKHETPAFWYTRALLFLFPGHGPGFCFSRRPITGSKTSPHGADVPAMSETQAEAIDMVHFTARAHQLTLTLRRGDLQLVNNLAVQHARDAFVDSDAQKRHMMRLWLRNERLAWQTPEGLRRSWEEKYGMSERRGRANWKIFPGASRARVLYRKDSCS